MDNELASILQQVQSGSLAVEDAEKLLSALDASEAPAEPVQPEPAATITVSSPDNDPPAPSRRPFRRYWEYPFGVGVILLGVAGLCVSTVPGTVLLICGWIFLILAALLVLVGGLSRWSPWVHIRINEHDGDRIAFSVPLPLRLIGSVVAFTRPWVHHFADEETAANLEMAASFLTVIHDLPEDEPITVEVDDEDGDHIQVYIG